MTSTQWREFDEGYVADCLPIEKALEGMYPVSKTVTRPQFDAFCKFLTQKYKAQIPDGYVFRLPSEAEWEYALDYEGTWLMYARQRKNWADYTIFDHELSRETMRNLIRAKKLNDYADWLDPALGWSRNTGPNNAGRIFIGGRLQQYAHGLCDAQQHSCFLLDRVLREQANKIKYFDREIDPLRWEKDADASVWRAWDWGREYNPLNWSQIQHLVLGPDLIKEKVWENFGKNDEVCVKPPMRHYAWNPAKVPKMIKKPKELTFKMVEGGDMVFCTIPAGTFNMSNPDGQAKLYHKVTLTKPFWITKYCVTTRQWREYARYDCEGLVRQVEKCFPKHPIFKTFTRYQWDGFCEFLNKRYGHQLPGGYVFRLPTEAEWEWAFIGEKDGDVRKLQTERFCNTHERFRLAFKEQIEKTKLAKDIPFDLYGWVADDPRFRVYVGGRVECSETFGVCDMVVHGGNDVCVFDTYDADGVEQLDGKVDAGKCDISKSCVYGEHEIDPVAYGGRLANRMLKRYLPVGRNLSGWHRNGCAHLVVGPDIETPLKKKELDPYSEEDFGGKLLSSVIAHGGLSSLHRNELNTAARFRRMLSTENTIEQIVEDSGTTDFFGFETQIEESPWVQLNLDRRRGILGIQIEALSIHGYHRSRHLRIWTSEDGKTWREVAAENQRKHRYRFDLQRKNVTAKYIRIGREPGFMNDYFSLEKILVYGK